MNRVMRYTAAAALTGAVALAAATPSEARGGRNAALFGGLAAGAIVGAAAAGAASGYYYGEPGYAPGYYDSGYYDPGYAYGPVYAEPYDSYGYAPAYRYRGWRGGKDLSIDSQR
jgi:hypothetical protein